MNTGVWMACAVPIRSRGVACDRTYRERVVRGPLSEGRTGFPIQLERS